MFSAKGRRTRRDVRRLAKEGLDFLRERSALWGRESVEHPDASPLPPPPVPLPSHRLSYSRHCRRSTELRLWLPSAQSLRLTLRPHYDCHPPNREGRHIDYTQVSWTGFCTTVLIVANFRWRETGNSTNEPLAFDWLFETGFSRPDLLVFVDVLNTHMCTLIKLFR